MKIKYLYYVRLIFAIAILLLSILAILGIFYPVKIFDIQFTPIFHRVITNFSLLPIILFILYIFLLLIFGRLYCSTFCPVGITQELLNLVLRKHKKRQENKLIKYAIMALTLGFLSGGCTFVLKYVGPYVIFSSALNCTITSIVILVLILGLTFYHDRYFCINICPVGAFLGLISKFSLYKISIDKDKCLSCGKCEKNCQAGCIDSINKSIDNEICLKCMKCLSICSQGAISYSKNVKTEFNPKRRDFIIATSLVALFGVAFKSGIKIVDNISKKISDIILPPGAKEKNRFLSKCFNCDLCIKNCPNKILTKSPDFNIVQIDYSKGLGYCEYNCNNCSKVCPTGAIERITLEEKQNTVIATAVVSEENCQKCMACIQACPKGAITLENNKITVNQKKCIGCGKCQFTCSFNAIKIQPVNKQSML